MRHALENLYRYHWDSFLQNVYIPNINTQHASAYPFLIYPSEHYMLAHKKVMICGQETFGWGGELSSPDEKMVEKLQLLYHNFVNKNSGEKNNIKKPGYNSPYWNFHWQLMKNNPDVGFVFQNVVKIGKCVDKGCDDTIFDLSQKYFSVWKDELDILKPNLIIFVTGNYDGRIRREIGSFICEPLWKGEFLDQLIFDDPNMPLCIRTNHPAYLQRTKRYHAMANKISRIIKNLKVD